QDAAGGAIFATDGSAVGVVRSQFLQNSVDVDRYSGGNGGAIASVNNTNVTISNSDFSQNYASGTAGAVRLIGGENTLTQVTFDRNSADFFGGAVTLNRTDHTVISNTLFQQNRSSDGGAFRVFGGSTTWENNVRFINNYAHGQAGGITSGDGGDGTIDGGTHRFDEIMADGNVADQDAGFLNIIGTDRAVDVTIRQSEIINNRAEDDGGAIDTYSNTNGYATVQFDDVLVSGNSAGDSGGGLRFRDGVDITLNHVRLVGNVAGDRANPDQGIFGQGGGLHIIGSHVSGNNVEIRNNQAFFGGGGAAVMLTNILAAADGPGVLSLVNSQIIGNVSTYTHGGGVLAAHGSKVTLTNVQANHNSAAGDGAAIYGLSSLELRPAADVTLFSSTVAHNVSNSNKDGVGQSAIYMESGGQVSPFGIVSDPAIFKSYNSVLAHTINGAGNTVTDYGGATPVEVQYTLVSKLDPLTGWSEDNNLLNINPQFTDEGAGLYGLRTNSPAIDAGTSQFLPQDWFDLDQDGNRQEVLPLDFRFNPRIENGQLDLGAVESGNLLQQVHSSLAGDTAVGLVLVSDVYGL
ncbi:MAG: hypothetical protein AAGA83_19225, partial [Cyanobacteria bacterium P01_F01_bin.116]